jgi:hypothetical protein
MAEEITNGGIIQQTARGKESTQAGRVRTVKACDCDGDDDENRCVGSDLGERRGRIQTFMCRGCEGQNTYPVSFRRLQNITSRGEGRPTNEDDRMGRSKLKAEEE